MLKIIGGIMIGVSCFYLGLRRSMSIKKRCASLKKLQNALSLLGTEIAFRGVDLKEAFLNIDCDIFKEAAKTIEADGIKRAWKKAVKKNAIKLCLTDGDTDTLLMLGARLGMTDTENQIQNINGIKNMLDLHIRAAQYDIDHFCRLYSGGGALAGIFLILMFI